MSNNNNINFVGGGDNTVHTNTAEEDTKDEKTAAAAPSTPRKTKKTTNKKDPDHVEIIHINELDPDIIPPRTKDFMTADQGGSKIVVCGKPGCFTAGTPILMFDGSIKSVENVLQGETIMGPDSKPRTVLELCRNNDEMFQIVPAKGDPYTVNLKHKLVLKSRGYNDTYKKGDIIEIAVEDFLSKTKTFQNRWHVFRTGVDFPTKKVGLDPYILGVWLGDGTAATSEFTNIDNEVVQALQDYADKNNIILKNKTAITYRMRSEAGTKRQNPILNFLRDRNLLKNKHIPQDYKVNDRKTRLELLAGIIDTDGSYDIMGNGYDVIQKNETVMDDIIFVARSLGFFAAKRPCLKSCMYKGKLSEGKYFRTFISGNIDEIPCRILRKQARARKSKKNNLVSGFKIVPQGKGDYYGFTIDGDHRFLLGSFDVVRNTGKTTLIASLLYAKKHIFPAAIAMSGTEDSNHFYRQIFPSTFVHNNYDEKAVERFIKRQKIAKEHLEFPWAVLILDDCTDDPALFRKPLQQGMYKRGRHWKMWYILSLQYGMDVRPVIRTNVDGVFILREPNLRNRRVMYENYGGIIPDFKLFCDILDQITDDYTALYIHNATKTNDWKDCVFWYKAKPIPKDWKFGCDSYWRFHYDRYNPDYVDPITV